jgi:hypothetical protein
LSPFARSSYCSNAWFEVVGDRDAKIGWGWVVLTPKVRHRAQGAIGTAWISKGHGVLCRANVCADVNAWFEVVGERDAKIGWG